LRDEPQQKRSEGKGQKIKKRQFRTMRVIRWRRQVHVRTGMGENPGKGELPVDGGTALSWRNGKSSGKKKGHREG